MTAAGLDACASCYYNSRYPESTHYGWTQNWASRLFSETAGFIVFEVLKQSILCSQREFEPAECFEIACLAGRGCLPSFSERQRMGTTDARRNEIDERFALLTGIT